MLSTKYRGAVFTDEHLRSLESIFRCVCTDFEAELLRPALTQPRHPTLFQVEIRGVSHAIHGGTRPWFSLGHR
ncbi:hypothetical protein PXNS11_690001 [Stutzerimonas xanthomarina]|nr:hypothetical protein PXNS11_690001 [Stutzerimonas xanthomarina]